MSSTLLFAPVEPEKQNSSFLVVAAGQRLQKAELLAKINGVLTERFALTLFLSTQHLQKKKIDLRVQFSRCCFSRLSAALIILVGNIGGNHRLWHRSRVKSRTPKKCSQNRHAWVIFQFYFCVIVRKFSENVPKAFCNKQYATMNEFCEFKSSNYQEITRACRFWLHFFWCSRLFLAVALMQFGWTMLWCGEEMGLVCPSAAWHD